MESFKYFLEETKRTGCTCWTGYKRKPGTKPCSPGSCVKEEAELEEAAPFKTKEDAVKYAKEKVKSHRDNLDGIEIHSHSGGFDVNHTSNSSGRNSLEKIGAKHLGTIYKEEAELEEAAVDAKGYKSSTGGLTQKGRDHYNAQSGGNLKAPVTTPPSKLKAGSKAANRRKSFCARMSGMEGPMKKPNGEPTRKALSLKKWNC